jgi:HrpA-like RNA helicase
MDPPADDSIAFAMERLVSLGAVSVADPDDPGDADPRGERVREREALTPLGHCLSRLPLDPAVGKMLLMGCLLQVQVLVQAGSRGLYTRKWQYTYLPTNG